MANSVSSNNFSHLYNKENKVKCLQCGRCTAGCPAARVFEDYNPRELMRRVQDGEEHTLDKDPIIWLCGQCYTCNSRCPRNNNPASIILRARERAYQQGYAPQEIYQQSNSLLDSLLLNGVTITPLLLKEKLGTLTELVDMKKLIHRRAELGLSQYNPREVPIPAKAIKQIRTIITYTSRRSEDINDT